MTANLSGLIGLGTTCINWDRDGQEWVAGTIVGWVCDEEGVKLAVNGTDDNGTTGLVLVPVKGKWEICAGEKEAEKKLPKWDYMPAVTV